MTRIASHSLAVFAAFIMAATSIGAIVSVPPAQANTLAAMHELA